MALCAITLGFGTTAYMCDSISSILIKNCSNFSADTQETIKIAKNIKQKTIIACTGSTVALIAIGVWAVSGNI